MRYLLDSNTFIQAKNLYYRMDVFPCYWDWIIQQNQAAIVSSINFVYDELATGNDGLAVWAKENKYLFIGTDDEDTQNAYAEVAEYIASNQAGMKVNAMGDFLSGADPWLIAKARTTNAIVVTHEKKDPLNRKKFLIPNVAEHFGVECLNTFDLLLDLRACFALP